MGSLYPFEKSIVVPPPPLLCTFFCLKRVLNLLSFEPILMQTILVPNIFFFFFLLLADNFHFDGKEKLYMYIRASKSLRRQNAHLRKIVKNLRNICTFERETGKTSTIFYDIGTIL